MMKEFDYELYRVVGFVEDKFGDHGFISVVGYCDDNLDVFHEINASEAKSLFPPKGEIFAHNFSKNHNERKGTLICICVRPNTNPGIDKDEFIWDKDEEVIDYGNKISNIKGTFTENGQHNYNILESNGCFEDSSEKFLYSENKVYHINSTFNARTLSYWNESTLPIVSIRGKLFIAGYSRPNYDGMIDVTNDELLIGWFLSNVVRKNWSNIIDGQSFRSTEGFLRETLSSLKNVDNVVVEEWFNRLSVLNKNLTLTFEKLKEISETTWFADVVKRSVEEGKNELLEQMKIENSSELNKLKEEYELEVLHLKEEQKKKTDELSEQVRTIENKLDEKNFEIEFLNETVKEKEQEVDKLVESIAKLNERKDSIIRDFSIIREVLNNSVQPQQKTQKTDSKIYSLEEIDYSDMPITRFKVYMKSLENILKTNGAQKIDISAMCNILATYNVVLCPCPIVAQAFILASHKCRYITEYVSAKWTSFDDLWENGLEFIVTKCYEEPEIMHFLLLQNINISYLPNFMQPLVDMQKKIITKFPATEVSFPTNLRILCTAVTDDELIPMSKEIIRNFGCIDRSIQLNTSQFLKFADDAHLGYLTPTELTQMREEVTEAPTMFEQYIDE